MIDRNLQARLLKVLYEEYVSKPPHAAEINWRQWAESVGAGEEVAMASYVDLEEKGLVEATAMGGPTTITANGVLFAEEHGLASADQLRRQNDVRCAMVDAYTRLYEEQGPLLDMDWEEVAQGAHIEADDFLRNLDLLLYYGHLEKARPQSLREFRASAQGRRWVHEIRSRKARVTRLNELVKAGDGNPAGRGHELEVLLRDHIETEGWDAEKNVRGPGEEHDVVICQGRDVFFLECRWRKEKAEAGDLSKLRDRISARAGASGLFVSMSGFTAGAVRDAEDRLERCVMLLFGSKDVGDVITGTRRFTDLLNERYKLAVTRRKIVFEQEKDDDL